MLPVPDAIHLIRQHLLHLPDETVSLEESVGRVLRQPLYADRDVPPFDRVTMDGIAFRYETFAGGERTFAVAGMQVAGQPAGHLTDAAACLEVMTGAVLPIGADTVVRYEDVTFADGKATLQTESVRAGQNVHRQGSDRPAGDRLLSPGLCLRAVDVAVAASVGAAQLAVAALPRVAIVATGDELVEVTATPDPQQIRHSNTYAVQAALRSLGIRASIHHLPDDKALLQAGLARLLESNELLLISGGVSAGKADYVPDTLAALGVNRHFHKVAQRPGKPLWFGSTANDRQVVFALPGNPVSTVMCTYKYVLPFLRASMGQLEAPVTHAQLAQTIRFEPALTYFVPVRLSFAPDGRRLAHPLPGSGSGDFTNLTGADAFLELPADKTEFRAEESFVVIGDLAS